MTGRTRHRKADSTPTVSPGREADASTAPASSRPGASTPSSPILRAIDFALRFFVYPLLLLFALAFVCIRPIPDPDTWFHLALGRAVLDSGTIPRGDLFSYTTPGGEWISSGWASSVAMEWVFRRGGARSLVRLVFGVVAVAWLAIYLVGVLRFRLRGGGAALLLLLAAVAGYLRFSPRPEVGSQLCVALLMLLLVSAGESPRLRDARIPWPLWGLPPLFALWANVHAGFMVGYIPVGVFCIWNALEARRDRRFRRLWALLPCVLSLPAWLLNPYGPRLVALAGKIKAMPHVRDHIMEWMPLWARTQPMLPSAAYIGVAAFLLLAAAVVVLSWRRNGAFPMWHLALLLFFAALAFYQRRHAGLAAVAISVILLPHLRVFDEWFGRFRAVPVLCAGALVAWIGVAQSQGRLAVGRGLFVAGVQGGILPAYAANFLVANRPPENLFNSYSIGGYLLYFLGPETKVFIDGRLDVYDVKVWLDYLAVESGQMPIGEAARKYDLNTFILYTKDAATNPNHLAPRLAALDDWKLVYFDDGYSIFVRKTPASHWYLAAHGYRYASPFRPKALEEAVLNPATRQDALEELSRAGAASQGSANTLALSAIAARALGDEPKARGFAARALARDPNCLLARELFGGPISLQGNRP